MIFKLSRKRYRQAVNVLSLLGSFVILLTAYIGSAYAARDIENMTDNTAPSEAEIITETGGTIERDAFEGMCPEAETAPETSALEDAVSADFEKQDVRMYVDKTMYSGRITVKDGTVYVSVSDFAPEVWDSSCVSGSESIVRVDSDKVSLTASSGACYLVANGRYLWCRQGVLAEEGEVMAPLSILCTVFGASRTEENGTVFVTSGDTPIQSGESYYNSESLYWLSRIISAESKGESLFGKIAVGNVVLNRTREPGYPDTIYDVIFDVRSGVQFTPVANGSVKNEPDEESVTAAKLCLEGVSISNDILYFLNPSAADNFWIVNNRTYVTTIGNHEFYS